MTCQFYTCLSTFQSICFAFSLLAHVNFIVWLDKCTDKKQHELGYGILNKRHSQAGQVGGGRVGNAAL